MTNRSSDNVESTLNILETNDDEAILTLDAAAVACCWCGLLACLLQKNITLQLNIFPKTTLNQDQQSNFFPRPSDIPVTGYSSWVQTSSPVMSIIPRSSFEIPLEQRNEVVVPVIFLLFFLVFSCCFVDFSLNF